MYDQRRNDLLDQISEIPRLELDNLNSEALCKLLLYGNPRFNNIANKLILEATISLICLLEGLGKLNETTSSAPPI